VRASEQITIRSFRVVFDLERRIHKVDRWRLPVPHGVPLRGVAYFVVALVAVVLLSRLPVAGVLVGALPPPVRYVVGPVAVAYALTQVRVDGRSAHAAIVAWIRYRLGARHLASFRVVSAPRSVTRLGEATIVPDERFARLRRAAVAGPARVLLRYPIQSRVRGGRRPVLRVEQMPGPPLFEARSVRLRSGQRLVVNG
jgi:hypothetical protein